MGGWMECVCCMLGEGVVLENIPAHALSNSERN